MKSVSGLAPVLALLLAAACTAADDDGGVLEGSDAGADEEGYGDYDGTGAGADDGDGPDDDIPNEEDEIDTGPAEDEDVDLDPGDLADYDDESGLPDEADPFLDQDPAFAPAAPELIPGCTATATVGGVPAWFHFTRPDAPCTGDAGKDRHILRELIRLIKSVPDNGRIDGHIFNISVDRVAEALRAAELRGVTVYLSTDGQVGGSKDVSKLIYLDPLKHRVYCTGSNRACIATADGAISHTKLFVFSHATAPDGVEADNVVWLGSANQTYSSGMKMFNNTVTFYGAEGLYNDLRHYLQDLYDKKRAADYYKPRSGRGRILRNPANVYISPEVETDLVTHRLDDLDASGDGCEVRVMQARFRDSRLAVVNRLVKMKKAGCDVLVVASRVDKEALSRLKGADIPVRSNRVHDKSFIVYGKFGRSFKYRVYTGSQNMGFMSARQFDEIFVKLAPESGASHPVYDAFVAHFADAYDDGDPL